MPAWVELSWATHSYKSHIQEVSACTVHNSPPNGQIAVFQCTCNDKQNMRRTGPPATGSAEGAAALIGILYVYKKHQMSVGGGKHAVHAARQKLADRIRAVPVSVDLRA